MLSGWIRGTEPGVRQGIAAAVIAGCLVASAAAAQQFPTDYTVPEGVTVLSEEELRTKIVGNSHPIRPATPGTAGELRHEPQLPPVLPHAVRKTARGLDLAIEV